MWGYRGELTGARWWVRQFTLPSLIGGAIGAWLLLHTSAARFERIVPFLVLGATVLFMVQGPVMKKLRGLGTGGLGTGSIEPDSAVSGMRLRLYQLYMLLVGVYGGYFGAGIGILMLALLGVMGFTNIHRMNGLKNWGGLCMNLVAALAFASSSLVNWPVALAMAGGGLAGGYGGSRLAQRVGQHHVRRAIVAIGLSAFVWLLLRNPSQAL
jgi:uncharacterized membrane protein YfcA